MFKIVEFYNCRLSSCDPGCERVWLGLPVRAEMVLAEEAKAANSPDTRPVAPPNAPGLVLPLRALDVVDL